MVPWHRVFATTGLVTLALAVLVPVWAADRFEPPAGKVTSPVEPVPGKYPANATEAEKREIDLLRVRGADAEGRKNLLAAYPFESLAERLTFDAPGRKRVAKALPTGDLDLDGAMKVYRVGQVAKVPPAALATLMAEERLAREGHFDRIRALAELHKLEVQKFVTNPGFGHMRLLVFRSNGVPEKPPSDWSEADRGEAVTLPQTGTFFTAGSDKKGPTLPAVVALAGFHTSTAHEFVRPDSWGLVKDKTQVAGFRSHTLEFVPDAHARRRLDTEKPIKDKAGRVTDYPVIERWAVRKVELIGLLMHESPVVYFNPDNKLPTMAAVRDAKTRELTAFEANGLKNLAAGKEVVVVDATTNQVRMAGAIRMAAACTKCHDGNRGDLLGAFTYDLVRDPAFVPPEK